MEEIKHKKLHGVHGLWSTEMNLQLDVMLGAMRKDRRFQEEGAECGLGLKGE